MPKWRLRELRAPKTRKIQKKSNPKNIVRPRNAGPSLDLGAEKGVRIHGFLVPFLSLGPSWDQNGVKSATRATGMAPDPIFNRFVMALGFILKDFNIEKT